MTTRCTTPWILALALAGCGQVADPADTTPPTRSPSMARAAATLVSTDGEVLGHVTVTPRTRGVQLHGKVSGLTPSARHGLHIHEHGTCGDGSDGFQQAGGHYAPDGHDHGDPGSLTHHAGDLGNLEAMADGVAMIDIDAHGLELDALLDRTIVVHAGADDGETQPGGDAGPRLACGTFHDEMAGSQ